MVPSLLLVFPPEFAQKKAGVQHGSWCCQQDSHAACPSHGYWQLSSWTQDPASGFLPFESLSWDLPCVSMLPNLPSHLVRPPIPHQKRRPRRPEQLPCDFSGLVPAPSPPPPAPLPPRSHAQPVLFTWYCADGRTGCPRPATTRVGASEARNRAILRTTLVKDHCFVS